MKLRKIASAINQPPRMAIYDIDYSSLRAVFGKLLALEKSASSIREYLSMV
jgi:hypothetical protein